MASALRGADPANGTSAIRAVLLGVTPGLSAIDLPHGSTLLAVDRSMELARYLWPSDLSSFRWVVQADWRSLPLRDESADAALGDGSLNCLRYPDQIRAALRSVARVLRPGGVLVIRLFVKPESCETRDQLIRDLAEGTISTFDQFKFRLWMALQDRVEDGILVSDLYQFWESLQLTPASLPVSTGWRPEAVATINRYKGSSNVLTFPSLSEWQAVFSETFDIKSYRQASSYQLGERCPIVVLKRRG